jgi:hypothetical protein
MTKQAPILNESMTKTGGISVIRASELFGHWLLVLGREQSGHGWRFAA